MTRRCALLGVLVVAFATACQSPPPEDPRFRPTESVLEAVAVLRRHVPDDTYRFPPGQDFTGRNVYRASLLRLESLERVHAGALRAGTWDDVIEFAKGRALERLRGYELAAASYRRAAEVDGPLQHEALASAAICDALGEALTLRIEAPRPGDDGSIEPLRRGTALTLLDTRAALLAALRPEVEGTHYEIVILEEIEHVDRERARFLVDVRRLYPDGDVRALASVQQLVSMHRESKNANQHLLSLADLYATLADDYVRTHPPETVSFDPPRFEELVESAARLYEAVSNQDGAPEKLEAARRLEAFLAFTLTVDRDRFSP